MHAMRTWVMWYTLLSIVSHYFTALQGAVTHQHMLQCANKGREEEHCKLLVIHHVWNSTFGLCDDNWAISICRIIPIGKLKRTTKWTFELRLFPSMYCPLQRSRMNFHAQNSSLVCTIKPKCTYLSDCCMEINYTACSGLLRGFLIWYVWSDKSADPKGPTEATVILTTIHCCRGRLAAQEASYTLWTQLQHIFSLLESHTQTHTDRIHKTKGSPCVTFFWLSTPPNYKHIMQCFF